MDTEQATTSAPTTTTTNAPTTTTTQHPTTTTGNPTTTTTTQAPTTTTTGSPTTDAPTTPGAVSCSAGFSNTLWENSCYFFEIGNHKNWELAEEDCQLRSPNAHLAGKRHFWLTNEGAYQRRGQQPFSGILGWGSHRREQRRWRQQWW